MVYVNEQVMNKTSNEQVIDKTCEGFCSNPSKGSLPGEQREEVGKIGTKGQQISTRSFYNLVCFSLGRVFLFSSPPTFLNYMQYLKENIKYRKTKRETVIPIFRNNHT